MSFAPSMLRAPVLANERLTEQLQDRDRLLMSWLAAAQMAPGEEKRHAVNLVAAQTRRMLGVRS